MIKSAIRFFCVALVTCATSTAFAGSHQWKIKEVFSSADGTVQFIELFCCCNGELALGGKWVDSNSSIENLISFPAGTLTANKHLLLGTAAYDALPNSPTPDYIINNNFLNTAGADLLEYWTYNTGDFAYIAGQLPLDGTTSLNCTAYNAAGCTTKVMAVNSPTNFAGVTGSIEVVAPCPADQDEDGGVGAPDLAQLLAAWGANPGHEADLDGDNNVGATDLAQLLAAWGPCD